MNLSVMLQALGLTALTLAFPFRIWAAMLATAERGEQARRSREMRDAVLLQEVRAELIQAIPVALDAPPPLGGGLP
jgi:hypothetical protein